MKIAIDVHSLGTQSGGNETYCRQLLRGLAQSPGTNEYDLFYAHSAALSQEGVGSPPFHFIPIPKNPIVRICAVLPRLLAQTKPDVFHAQYVLPPFVRTKTVLAIHDLAHEHYPEFFHPLEARRMKILVPWSAKRASHIMTISEFSAADIARRFDLPREKIAVAHLAASPDFHPREKGESREHLARKFRITFPFILYVGRIQARKNLSGLVEAYARLRKQGLDAKLVLVGKKDWQAGQLLEKIKELGLEESVVFPGFVPFDDLPIFYNAAEVFVFPSFFEGFGLPVVESMASGVPTITSFGSSLEEVAGDGALLIDPRDTGSITDALGKVLGDPGLQRDLTARGLKRSKDFTAGNLAEKALAVYHSLAGS
ncbi:MAG TPA: glycosyltransferase family 1 protein [Candidatus Angelobacter sp.]|jgi:glycosyltransferase involved in cell wall biosynthesis